MTFSFMFVTTRIFQLTSLASTAPSSSWSQRMANMVVSTKEDISQFSNQKRLFSNQSPVFEQKRLFSNQSRCRGSIREGTKKNPLFSNQSTLTHDQRNQEESSLVTNTLFSKLPMLKSTDFAPLTRIERCTGWPFNKKCKSSRASTDSNLNLVLDPLNRSIGPVARSCLTANAKTAV